MNDDFLQRLRVEPPPAFLANLKAQLDRAAMTDSPRRRWPGLRLLALGFLLGGAAVALALMLVGSVPRDAPRAGDDAIAASARPAPVTPTGAAGGGHSLIEGGASGAAALVAAMPAVAMPAVANASITFAGPAMLVDTAREASNRLLSKGWASPELAAVDTTAALALFCRSAGSDADEAAGGRAARGTRQRYPDLVAVDRRMRKSEFEACARNGVIRVSEFNAGYEAVIVVRSQLYGAPSLALVDLLLALAAEVPDPAHPDTWIPNPYTTWSQIDPRLGDEKIDVAGPALSSPEGKTFIELVLEAGCRSVLPAPRDPSVCRRVRSDGVYQEFDPRAPTQRLADHLDANPNAYALLGVTFLQQGSRFTPAAIDGVAPTSATIAAGAYPGSRGLFVYANDGPPHPPRLSEFLAALLQRMAENDNTAFSAPDDARRRKNAMDAYWLPALTF